MALLHKSTARFGAIGLALASAVFAFAGAKDQARSDAQNALDVGRALYAVQCAYCHGAGGKGDGEASGLMYPRPRDLTRGLFSLRSTPAGSPPTDEDLLKTITRGIPGSAMPGFSFLSESERRALVRYVRTFSMNSSEADGERKAPVKIGAPPPFTAKAVAAGKAVYEKLGCAHCHGPHGKGDGDGAEDLFDDTGLPIKAGNLTSGQFKGGASVSDIYLRITTGMDGTPMPAWDQTSQADRWNLAYYVRSLSRTPSRDVASESAGLLMSSRARAALPLNNPFAAAWKNAPRLRVPLNPMWNRGVPTPELIVRSLHDGETIAFLIVWADRTKDARTVRTEDFRDSAAIQFFSGDGYPSIAMGDRDAEVIIWQWKADWQQQIDQGRRTTLKDVYPWMADEPNRPPSAPLLVGNPNALVRRSSPVEEAIARGFGALKPKPLPEQQVGGKGVWRDGRWYVVLSRKLGSNSGIAMSPRKTKLGFAIWNGNTRDRNGQKAISTWYSLVFGS